MKFTITSYSIVDILYIHITHTLSNGKISVKTEFQK